MPVAVLTAAVQNIVPPAEQRADPLGAAQHSAMTWIDVARRLGIGLQLGAALPLVDAYMPPEAMLDPVASHLAVRTMSASEGVDLSDHDAQAIIRACNGEVQIYDLGFFENLLHPDLEIRARIHAHLLRCARAAKSLAPVGCAGVTGFIGRHPGLDMDQNVALFEQVVIPLLQQFKDMGLTYWVEPCPMPGWNTMDTFINNIAYCPGMWIKLYRIAQKHGVERVLRITYDESHDILMGTTHHGSFAAMLEAGLPFMVSRFHGKNQYRDPAKVAAWTGRGKMIDLGCRIDGQPHPDPAKQGGAWGVMPCAHGMIGIGHYNPLAMLMGKEADWLDHQLAVRTVLGLNPSKSVFILEHEWGAARVQDLPLVEAMLSISVAFIQGVDAAADALCRAGLWCREGQIPLPGTPSPLYDLPGLDAEVEKIVA